jgi:hypothetical protein
VQFHPSKAGLLVNILVARVRARIDIELTPSVPHECGFPLKVIAHEEDSIVLSAAIGLILNLNVGAFQRLAYGSLEIGRVDGHGWT